jgi:hypothetical protein
MASHASPPSGHEVFLAMESFGLAWFSKLPANEGISDAAWKKGVMAPYGSF